MISLDGRKIYKLISNFINLIFPERCFGCRIKGEVFCKSCQGKIITIKKPYCKICKFPYTESLTYGGCSECVSRYPVFKKLITAGIYNGILKKLIHLFKYHGKKQLAEPFGKLMAEQWTKEKERVDYIVPVPIHSKRLKERGYNPADLLLNEFNKYFAYDKLNILIRVRPTFPQYELNRKERELNIKGAFEINQDTEGLLKNKSILLIDDIFTSGITANEISRILLEAKAKEIYVLTLARTLLKS